MELIAYIRLFRKWFWLIALGTFLAGGTAFLHHSSQPDVYQAKATLLVGGFIQSPNPDTAEITTGRNLAQTYAALARTTDVLEATVETGDLPISAAELGKALQTQVLQDTSLLELRVTYTDPVLAADMANRLAAQLRNNSPTNLTAEQAQQISLADAEIERLQRELENDRRLRATTESQLETATDPEVVQHYTEDLNTIASRIIATSGNIAGFQRTITSLQQRTNSLDIVERARIPSTPVGSSTFSVTLLGAMIGGALASGIALLIEYLDDTLHTAEETTQTLAVPHLATISRFGKSADGYAKRLVTCHDPSSPVSEEYRALRTNLLFTPDGSTGMWRGFVVTSPGPSEGKSVTTANLAVTMAAAGWRVLLVDADLRRPRVHEIFKVDNSVGLSTLLSSAPDERSEAGAPPDFMQCVQETDVPGLFVLPSGHTPLNPTELLGSAALMRRYREIGESNSFSIVLFDTSPILVVTDGVVLASALKLPVVLVLEAGRTRRAAALRAKDRLDQLNIALLGTVLNAANPKEQAYGQGYSYYYYQDSVKS